MPESGTSYWQQVEEIFHQALDLPAEARGEFLREHCGDDAALETEVRDILKGYEAQDRLAADANAPARFGPFEVVREIGEGGMGAVYLARRSEDFEQRVAIKVISGSPAAATLMAERFRQERQILAGLNHPNIARLLDGGVNTRGQSYLVMEYVEGVRLDRFCDAEHLSANQRLELFRKICAAVHFAHQHLVIHRDLKPGNILVDKDGEPKLLDFGIAKVLPEPGTSPDQTMTMTAGLMLTPEYASPEQVRGLPCTVASDIYSLGVILYELLTGKGPYSATGSTPAERIAAVVTGEVQRPSLTAPENLRASLRGDLDGIVVKALAKRPEDRYGSVEQLSEDLRRHMEGLPVTAVEGTRLYVARKFVRRHSLAVGAAALLLLTLIGGLAATLWQARVAERERALAEQRFSDARKLANYLLFSLYDAVQSLPGSLPVRAGMASESLQYLDRLAAAKSNDRALRLELAEGYVRLGSILEAPYGSGDTIGDTTRAEQTGLKALAILEPLSRDNPADARVQQDLARAYLTLGPVLNFRGKPREALADLNRATAIFDRLAASQPRDPKKFIDAGIAYMALLDIVSSPGGGFQQSAAKDQVIAAADKAIALFNAALKISPLESRALVGLAQAHQAEGNIISGADPARGITMIRTGLDALHRLPPAIRSSLENQVLEARLETMVGWCQERMGQYVEAIATLERPRQILDGLAVIDPKNATNARRRANLYGTLALIQLNLKHNNEALADYRKVIEIWDGLIATDPSKLSYRVIRAAWQGRAARLLADSGRMSEAMPYAKASIDYLKEIADLPDAAAQNLSEASIVLMVTPVLSLRDYPRALRYAQRADELTKGKEYEAIIYLAQAYANVGDAATALRTVKRGLAIVPPPAPGQKPSEPRRNLEEEQRDIEVLIKTGHLPPNFNR